MAKLSSINKNERRKKLVKKYAGQYAKLKAIADDESRDDTESGDAGGSRPKRRRRRGRRGGRGRRKELEATFDHGETDGYGLWLDASVKDNPVYLEHWAGKRDVTVRIDADQIIIRRAGSPAPESEDSGSDPDSDD